MLNNNFPFFSPLCGSWQCAGGGKKKKKLDVIATTGTHNGNHHSRRRTYCRVTNISRFHWFSVIAIDVTMSPILLFFFAVALIERERKRTRASNRFTAGTPPFGCERIDFRRRQTDGNLHNYLIGPIKNRQVVVCGR